MWSSEALMAAKPLTVLVRRSDEVVDLQAFAEAYARAIIAEAQRPQERAA